MGGWGKVGEGWRGEKLGSLMGPRHQDPLPQPHSLPAEVTDFTPSSSRDRLLWALPSRALPSRGFIGFIKALPAPLTQKGKSVGMSVYKFVPRHVL